MLLNEIKLEEKWADEILHINKFYPTFKTRDSKGGGVAILIKEGIEFEEITIPPQFKDLEITGILIKINGKKTAIFAYYNPPQSEVNYDFFKYLENKYKDFLVGGDLNAKIKPYNSLRDQKNGKILEKIILNQKCLILNDPENKTPTSHWKI